MFREVISLAIGEPSNFDAIVVGREGGSRNRAGSGCVVFQAVCGLFHGLFSLTIVLRMTSSFRMQAVATTLCGLP
jgi:hypothetical protein